MSINKLTDKIVFSLLTNINYGKLELTNYDNKKYSFGKDSNGLNVKLVFPNLVVYFASELTSTGINPGLLSTVCVPAARIMVVKSNLSFLCPTT